MDDLEWEYEYDEEETEVVYFTLDMTTHVPPELPTKKTAAKKPVKASTRDATLEREKSQSEIPEDSTTEQTPQPPLGRLQVVHLHGPNPLVSYDNKFYSCYWGTDIGTSIFLTKPSKDPQYDHLPLRSYRSFDLLGTSCARLMAVPATFKPRLPNLASAEAAAPLARVIQGPDVDIYENGEGDKTLYSATQGLQVQLSASAPPDKVSQARFLERFAAAKMNRGEKGLVPTRFINTYTLPEGWEAEKEEWLLKETGLSKKNRQEAVLREQARKERRRQGMMEDGDGQGDDENDARDEDGDQRASDGGVLRMRRRRPKRSVENAFDKGKGKEPAKETEGDDQPAPKKRRGPTGKPNGRPRKIVVDPDFEEEAVVAESSRAALERETEVDDATALDGEDDEDDETNVDEDAEADEEDGTEQGAVEDIEEEAEEEGEA